MIVKTYTVMCDVCGEESEAEATSIDEARAMVKQLGWTQRRVGLTGGYIDPGDVCPLHAHDKAPMWGAHHVP